ncbi:hypothetical protein [Acidianus brierleyi]|uniref:hypothetical protein n=1 Tax=Acidianus brierleyi TaxID=41673 RepID=UPI0013A58AE4|nr:hypothetical protein [Acidianus brierleyi]
MKRIAPEITPVSYPNNKLPIAVITVAIIMNLSSLLSEAYYRYNILVNNYFLEIM